MPFGQEYVQEPKILWQDKKGEKYGAYKYGTYEYGGFDLNKCLFGEIYTDEKAQKDEYEIDASLSDDGEKGFFLVLDYFVELQDPVKFT